MAAALRAELAELAEARLQVEARLRPAHPTQGAGRGRGLVRRGAPAPPGQRPNFHAERVSEVGPRRPLLSSVVVLAGEDGDMADAAPALAAEPEPVHEQVETLKRPQRTEDDNPQAVKRNKRMFGALLGTLQKFRQEEGASERKDAVAKHTTMLQRAEEREREESKRLRELERGEASEKRRSELLLQQRLAAEMEEKQLRLGHLTWLEAHARRASFLVTQAAPPLYFLPAVLCSATEAALSGRPAVCELEAQQAEDRLAAALVRVAEASAAAEAKLLGNPRAAQDEYEVVAEAAVVEALPEPECAASDDMEDAEPVAPSGLAGVLDVQDT